VRNLVLFVRFEVMTAVTVENRAFCSVVVVYGRSSLRNIGKFLP
jgi:hypothetical protein